jgi:cell cycle sensor histidine kinase DivJ
VPPADLERILMPFEQGGRGTADHSDGAGLGLTLVKAFCELHGGTLKIESADGFTATIELPAAES